MAFIKWCLLGLLLLPLAYLSFKKISEYSWIIVLLAIFAYILLLGLKSKSEIVGIIFFNISAIFFALFLFEGFLKLRSLNSGKSIQNIGIYTEAHPYLGYGPKKDGIYTHKRIVNDQLIFDNVSYTFKDGLRYTPNSNDKSQDCVLFFGCSITFGEGLHDTLTLPFFFNKYAKQQYKVLNYGFSGFGPHQMLAYIENRVSEDIQKCKNKRIAIYTFFEDHIARAAGYAMWDQDGPKYEIINGSLKKTGSFNKLPKKIFSILIRSYTFRKLFIEKKASHKDLLLTIEIIKKSNELLLKDGVILYVFIRNTLDKDGDDDYFLRDMRKNNIKTFLLTDAIPNYYENEEEYVINPLDMHPNGSANEKIAEYLYLHINNH
jgi:hypothetical protein